MLQPHAPSAIVVAQEGYTVYVRAPSPFHGPDGLAPSFKRQSCDSEHTSGDPAEDFLHSRFTGGTDGAHIIPNKN